MRNCLGILIFLMLISSSCNSENISRDAIGGFDISKDDQFVLFSYTKQGVSSIYKMPIGGGEANLLIGSNEGLSYVNPKYSPDGNKIVFIGYEKGDANNSSLYLANSDGTSIVSLTSGTGIITEAIFTTNETVIFLKANEYEKYSPIGVKDAHDFDIYSIHLPSKEISRLSNINAYGINHISVVDSNRILLRLEEGPNGGIYLFSRSEPETSRRLPFKDSPLKDESMYYNPVYSQEYNVLAFTAPYKLYKMNLESKEIELVYDATGTRNLDEIAFFNTQPRLLFTQQGLPVFYSISLDGEDLQKIEPSI
jgi:hypothetical protein